MRDPAAPLAPLAARSGSTVLGLPSPTGSASVAKGVAGFGDDEATIVASDKTALDTPLMPPVGSDAPAEDTVTTVAPAPRFASRALDEDEDERTRVDDGPTTENPKIDGSIDAQGLIVEDRAAPAPQGRVERISGVAPTVAVRTPIRPSVGERRPLGRKEPTPSAAPSGSSRAMPRGSLFQPDRPDPAGPADPAAPFGDRSRPGSLPEPPGFASLSQLRGDLPEPPGFAALSEGLAPVGPLEAMGPGGVDASAALDGMELAPMPIRPNTTSPLAAVQYLWPVARGVWVRLRADKTLRARLHDDQHRLDAVLRELGQAAREEELTLPALEEELGGVHAQEDRRTRAENEMAHLDMSVANERDRWSTAAAEQQEGIAATEAELAGLEEQLRDCSAQRSGHVAERARLDALIRTAEKRAQQLDAKAQKADVTPPEKGGGPNTAANARREAEEARAEATALMPSRDSAREQAEALDGPIAELTDRLSEGRSRLQQQRAALAAAESSHRQAVAGLEQSRSRAEAERQSAQRELSQRFVSVGTLLNLNRVQGPRFGPIYARVDELKGAMDAREATINQLELERRSFDRAVVQRGLIVVGACLGVLSLLAIVLVVLLAR